MPIFPRILMLRKGQPVAWTNQEKAIKKKDVLRTSACAPPPLLLRPVHLVSTPASHGSVDGCNVSPQGTADQYRTVHVPRCHVAALL